MNQLAPILGDRCGRDGAFQESAGVMAEALDHLRTEFVLLVEILEEPLVDGVEGGDKEVAHSPMLVDCWHWSRERSKRGPLLAR